MNRLKLLSAEAKRTAVAGAVMSVVLQVLLVGTMLGQVHALA
jgi:hypothetical protein